jgi:hypothetical protein
MARCHGLVFTDIPAAKKLNQRSDLFTTRNMQNRHPGRPEHQQSNYCPHTQATIHSCLLKNNNFVQKISSSVLTAYDFGENTSKTRMLIP